MRRDHAKTPPKPDIEMVAKAMNNSASVGETRGGTGVGSELVAADDVMRKFSAGIFAMRYDARALTPKPG